MADRLSLLDSLRKHEGFLHVVEGARQKALSYRQMLESVGNSRDDDLFCKGVISGIESMEMVVLDTMTDLD